MPGLLADSGGFISFLIYFVIAIFWVIGKVMQQRDAKRRIQDLKRRREEREREEQRTGKPYVAPARPSEPPPRPPPVPKTAPAKSLEQELQEFLGRLAGLEPEPPPAAPPPRKQKPLITFDGPAPPPAPARTPEKTTAVKEDVDEMAAYAKIKDIEDIQELELDPDKASFGGPDVLMNVRSMMIDMSRTTLKVPTIHIPTLRSTSTRTRPPDVRTPDALRQAILSGILLSPPKALMENPFHNEPGQL